jgi:hypothetical protein
MVQSIVELKQVLSDMERLDRYGKPTAFDIVFKTANDKLNTGGDTIKLKGVRLAFVTKTGNRTLNPKNKVAQNDALLKQGRAPQHVKNGTINMVDESGNVTKCHIWLIDQFNGKTVKWHIHG